MNHLRWYHDTTRQTNAKRRTSFPIAKLGAGQKCDSLTTTRNSCWRNNCWAVWDLIWRHLELAPAYPWMRWPSVLRRMSYLVSDWQNFWCLSAPDQVPWDVVWRDATWRANPVNCGCWVLGEIPTLQGNCWAIWRPKRSLVSNTRLWVLHAWVRWKRAALMREVRQDNLLHMRRAVAWGINMWWVCR
jgi:hypothetical protein